MVSDSEVQVNHHLARRPIFGGNCLSYQYRKIYMKSNIKFFKRIKFYFERKSMFILLYLLTIVFSILAVKSSNEPVFDFLHNYKIENYLYQFPNSNNFIWDISIGFLISVIFYIIVVYIPDRRKRKDIEPFINDKCESIIFSSYGLISEVIRKSNLPYQYKTLTPEQFNEICKAVNPKEHIYNFHNGFSNITQNHLGYKIFNSWTRIINEIDDLIRLLPYIDSGLLKRIYKLYNNFLKYSAKNIAEIEKIKNENLEAWSPTLYSFYLETKELRDYYRLYSKNEFKNDPLK